MSNITFRIYFAIISILANVLHGALTASSVANDSWKYPFMVSLQQLTADGSQNATNYYYTKHFCGGSLLNDRWILSAAHCLWQKNIKEIVITIASKSNNMNETKQSYEIERIEYFHFIPSNMRNDIALILLRNSICGSLDCSNDYITKMHTRLPSYGMKASRRQSCRIIGYGGNEHGNEMKIQEGEVYLISNKICTIFLGDMWSPKKGDNTICAMGKFHNACVGDSGGPLLCNHNAVSYIYGIISYGSICNSANTAGVYTLTAPYTEWIKKTIIQ